MENIVAAGKNLIAAKADVGHGAFLSDVVDPFPENLPDMAKSEIGSDFPTPTHGWDPGDRFHGLGKSHGENFRTQEQKRNDAREFLSDRGGLELIAHAG